MQAGYAEGSRRVTVANSEGRFAVDDRTRVRLGVQVVARRNGAVETGFETLGGHRGFELVTEGAAERDRRAGGASRAHPARRRPGAGRRDAGGRRRRLRRRALSRDDRPRPRGRPHPEGRLGLRRQARRGGRGARTWTPTTTVACPASGGPTASTTRARRPRGPRVIHEGRITSYLYDLVRAPQGRRRLDRQRPPPELSPPADPADDQHLHRPRRGDARGADRRGRARLLRRLVRRRPGRPDHRRLRLRRLGGLPDRGRRGDQALSRRDPDRQLPRHAARGSTASPTTSR